MQRMPEEAESQLVRALQDLRGISTGSDYRRASLYATGRGKRRTDPELYYLRESRLRNQ